MTTTKKGSTAPKAVLAVSVATSLNTLGAAKRKLSGAEVSVTQATKAVVREMRAVDMPLIYLTSCTGSKVKELKLSEARAKVWKATYKAVQHAVAKGALTAADLKLYVAYDSKAACEKAKKGKGDKWSECNATVTSYVGSLRNAYKLALEKAEAGDDPEKPAATKTDREKMYADLVQLETRLQNFEPERATSAVVGGKVTEATAALRNAAAFFKA